MKFAMLIAAAALLVSCALAKKEQKKPIPEYIKKMFAENKGKREAAIAPYSYASPHRAHSLYQSGGGSLNLGSFGVPKTLAQLGFSDSNGLNFGSGYASSMQSHFPGMQAYSPSFGGSSFSGVPHFSGHDSHRGGNFPRYTSINGLFKPHAGGSQGSAGSAGSIGSAGAQFSEVSLTHTGPQTFGHSFSGSHPQSTYAVPQFASKPGYGFSAPSFANSHSNSNFDIHSQSLPSYSATKGLGAYSSSGAHSGFSLGSQGHSSPSLGFQGHSSPSLAFSAPSSSYGVPSYGASHGGLNALSFSSAGNGGQNGGHSFASDGSLSSSKNAFAGFFDTGKPSIGLSGSSKLSSSYGPPSSSDFKPSVYLGSSASSSSNSYSVPSSSHSALSSSHSTPLSSHSAPLSSHSAPLSSHSAPLSSHSIASHSQNSLSSVASQLGLSAADHEKLLAGTPVFISPKGFGHSSGIDLSSLIAQGSHGGSQSSQGSLGGSLLSQGSHGGSLLSQGSHGGSLLSQGSHGGSLLSQGSHGGSLLSQGSHGGSLLSQGSHGGSLLSQGSHGGSLLPQGSYGGSLLSQGSHGGSLLSQGSHGSPSLSGSYNFPSAGHSAPSISFGQLLGGHGAPSSNYGAPSFSHGASSDFSSLSQGISSPSFGGHGSGGGYATEENQSEGFGHPSSGGDALVSGFSSSIIHGSSNSHVPSSSYGAPSISYGAPSSNYGVPSSGFAASSTEYGAPSAHGFSGSDYSGSSGLSFEGLGSSKLELPSQINAQSFSGSSHGGLSPSSSYGIPSHGFSAPSSSYGAPHDTYGLPKNSFSHDDSQHAQSETKYNTIKYSRSLDSVKENKKMRM